MSKKRDQLGMNPSTASGRLLKDILFKFVCEMEKNLCHQCGEPMERETFSVEHVVPWLDSDDPIGLFFDLENISFSHRTCNYAARRVTNKKYHTGEDRRKARNKLERERWSKLSKTEQKKQRREKYERNGV